jgi:hypothetical protein
MAPTEVKAEVMDYTPKDKNAKKRRQDKRALDRGEEVQPKNAVEVKEAPKEEPVKKKKKTEKKKKKTEDVANSDVAPPEASEIKETGFDLYKRAREILKENRRSKKDNDSNAESGGTLTPPVHPFIKRSCK